MKKALFVIAFLCTSVFSNLALAGTYSYTSPWRPPYFEQGDDSIDINVNDYCSSVQVSGSFNPSASWPSYDTYCDWGIYQVGNAVYNTIYLYMYSANQTNGTSFSHTHSVYDYYDIIRVYMNASNGSGSYTISWY